MSWGGPKVDRGSVKIDPNNVDESVRKNADTHKMSSETIRAAGVDASKRPPGSGSHPGEVLHQQRRLPFSYPMMALAGFGIAAIIGYGVLYSKKKREADAIDVARVATNTARPENTEPPKK